jgi:hypothetical protein
MVAEKAVSAPEQEHPEWPGAETSQVKQLGKTS